MSIKIVSHASPRWKAARNREEAKIKNKILSIKRADAALAVLKKLARAEFVEGAKLEFQHNITHSTPHESTGNVIFETDPRGDVESLQRAKGDTEANNQFFRRVDITIQFSVRKLVDAGRSTTSIVRPTTREWEIAITDFFVGGFGPGGGMVNFLLKNRKTNQVVKASSTLEGVAVAFASAGGAQRGKEKWVFFKTDEPTNWDDFKNTKVNISHAGIDPFFLPSVDKTILSFGELGVNKLDLTGWATGGSAPGGGAWTATGKLKLTKPAEKIVPKTEHDWTPTIESDEVFIPIYFDTSKSKITRSAISTLGDLVKQAAGQFKQRQGL